MRRATWWTTNSVMPGKEGSKVPTWCYGGASGGFANQRTIYCIATRLPSDALRDRSGPSAESSIRLLHHTNSRAKTTLTEQAPIHTLFIIYLSQGSIEFFLSSEAWHHERHLSPLHRPMHHFILMAKRLVSSSLKLFIPSMFLRRQDSRSI